MTDIDLDAVLSMDDLVRSDDALFIGAGVTDSELLKGVQVFSDGAQSTETLVLNAHDSSARIIRSCHRGEAGQIHF